MRGDQRLGLNVEFQLDVVRLERVDIQRRAEVRAQQGAGRARGGDGEIERVHGLRESLVGLMRHCLDKETKKMGGENEFSSHFRI